MVSSNIPHSFVVTDIVDGGPYLSCSAMFIASTWGNEDWSSFKPRASKTKNSFPKYKSDLSL